MWRIHIVKSTLMSLFGDVSKCTSTQSKGIDQQYGLVDGDTTSWVFPIGLIIIPFVH